MNCKVEEIQKQSESGHDRTLSKIISFKIWTNLDQVILNDTLERKLSCKQINLLMIPVFDLHGTQSHTRCSRYQMEKILKWQNKNIVTVFTSVGRCRT